jgi:RNA polymerase sigma-70 factor (ECF subfamily)
VRWLLRAATMQAHWIVSRPPALRVLSGGAQAPSAAPSPPPESRADPLDFDAVFRRYAPYVAAIALKIIGRDNEVDDVVQDVFVEAHRGLSRLRDQQSLKPWLARITVRRAHRRVQRHWLRRVLRLAPPTEFDGLADPGATPEQRAQVASAYRLLERLSPKLRVVWILRQVEEESLERIAELCGCSLSTVQRRLRAAQAHIEQGHDHG